MEFKSHKLSTEHAFESATSDSAVPEDQMQQVKRSEGPALAINVAELVNNANENSPCVIAQQ